jgi:hypothetical protein
MKIDRREFDRAADAQADSNPERLTGTPKSALVNPVLPSEFEQRANAHHASTNDAKPETPDATDSGQAGATVTRP